MTRSRPHGPRPHKVTPPASKRPGLAARIEPLAARFGPLVLALLMTGYTALMVSICATKLRHYLYTDFDLPIFVQGVEGILRGNLHSTIRGLHILGDHSSLNLFLIAPIYALFRTPMTLLVVQTVTLALGAIAAWRLARRELSSATAGLAFAAAYLFYPAIGYTNLYEFHPETLSTPALLFALDALRAGRFRRTLLFTALALLGKEDVPLVVLAMAATAWVVHRPNGARWALSLAALAVAFAALSFAVLKPLYGAATADYGRLYINWGTTPGEIIGAMARAPWKVVASLFVSPGYDFDTIIKVQYWIHMLLPLAGLSLLSPLTLLPALPIVTEHFVSWRSPQHTILYHYTALVSPFFMGAAAVGARALLARFAGAARDRDWKPSHGASLAVAIAVLAATLLANLLFGPVIGRGAFQYVRSEEPNTPSSLDRTLTPYRDRMMASLDRSGTVVAGYQFLPQLTRLHDVRSIHNIMLGTHTFSTEPYPNPTDVSGAIVDFAHFRVRPYADSLTGRRLREFLALNDLHPVEAAGDIVRFQRAARETVALVTYGAAPPPEGRRIVFDGTLEFLGHAVPAREVAPGGVLPIQTWWQRTGRDPGVVVTEIMVLEPFGRQIQRHMRHLGFMVYPAADWPAGVPVREDFGLVIPDAFPPGTYDLGLRVGTKTETGQRLMDADDPDVMRKSRIVELGRFTVTAAPAARR